MLPLRLAFRILYLSKKDRSVRIFSWVSIFSIALTVFLFLLIDSVMNGFSLRLQKILMGFEAPYSSELSAKEDQTISFSDFLKKNKEDVEIYNTQEFYGVLKNDQQPPVGIKVKAVDKEYFKKLAETFPIYWLDFFDIESFFQFNNAILVGEEVYKNLNLLPGDDEIVNLIHPFADLGPTGELEPQKKSFFIAGIISTGHYDIDSVYVFMTKESLHNFANKNLLGVHYYFYPHQSEKGDFKTLIHKQNPKWKYKIQHWTEKNPALLKAMKMEKIIFFILFLILGVVSCFNLSGVVRIFVMNKQKDLFVLKTIGATKKQLYQIFQIIGVVLGSFGVLLGVSLGILFIIGFQHLDFTLPEAYGFSKLPISLNPLTVTLLIVLTPVFTFLISTFSVKNLLQLLDAEGVKSS